MNTIQKIALSAAIAAAAALSVLPAAAHHSTAAFDGSKVVKIEGTVKQFRWINPHASFKVEGKSEGDAPDGLWTVEMTAPNVLINEGWTRTALQEGDKVTVFVNPLRNAITLNDGSQGGLYVGVVLASGKKLGQTDGTGRGSSQ
ncbi:MAG TPA: DUF6152 family protein [Gammaproteobacteria bacterium]|nr:DUF6152 family protein [Gammaproteobacteria bacterium]